MWSMLTSHARGFHRSPWLNPDNLPKWLPRQIRTSKEEACKARVEIAPKTAIKLFVKEFRVGSNKKPVQSTE